MRDLAGQGQLLVASWLWGEVREADLDGESARDVLADGQVGLLCPSSHLVAHGASRARDHDVSVTLAGSWHECIQAGAYQNRPDSIVGGVLPLG